MIKLVLATILLATSLAVIPQTIVPERMQIACDEETNVCMVPRDKFFMLVESNKNATAEAKRCRRST